MLSARKYYDDHFVNLNMTGTQELWDQFNAALASMNDYCLSEGKPDSFYWAQVLPIQTSLSSAECIKSSGDEFDVVDHARVSTGSGQLGNPNRHLQNQVQYERDLGLLNALLRDRHWAPFQHLTMTFDVLCPIFVARQIMRHRAFHYSEVSLRYTHPLPVFYKPDHERKLVQTGSPMAYNLKYDIDLNLSVEHDFNEVYGTAWNTYRVMIEQGTCREMARIVLPTALYTRFHMTCDLRNLLESFLVQRVSRSGCMVRGESHPQVEVESIAQQIEHAVAQRYPHIYEAYCREFGVSTVKPITFYTEVEGPFIGSDDEQDLTLVQWNDKRYRQSRKR